MGDLLQEPNFENLGSIGEEISSAIYSSKKKEKILQQCLRDDVRMILLNYSSQAVYLKKLRKTFADAEEYKYQGNLTLVFYIYKALVCFNDPVFIERMLCDDMYMDTIGIFECKSIDCCTYEQTTLT